MANLHSQRDPSGKGFHLRRCRKSCQLLRPRCRRGSQGTSWFQFSAFSGSWSDVEGAVSAAGLKASRAQMLRHFCCDMSTVFPLIVVRYSYIAVFFCGSRSPSVLCWRNSVQGNFDCRVLSCVFCFPCAGEPVRPCCAMSSCRHGGSQHRRLQVIAKLWLVVERFDVVRCCLCRCFLCSLCASTMLRGRLPH